jgi:hypothetical protein
MSGGAGAPVSGDATREDRRAADTMVEASQCRDGGGGMSGGAGIFT